MLKHTFRYFLVASFIFFVSCAKDDDSQETNNPTKSANRQGTGDSANDFLSEDNFTDLVIEVVYVEGFEPSQTSLDYLVSFINQRCYKPGGVEINKRSIASPNKELFAIREIDSIERQIRTQYNSGSKLALFSFFVDGEYKDNDENSVVLGVAYRNTSFVIFEETIQKFSNDFTEPSRVLLESTVYRHEFSHLLGLVDFGSEMQTDHLDTENGHHCDVETCLMNYRVESGINVGGMISEENIPKLDSQCLADLRANGGR